MPLDEQRTRLKRGVKDLEAQVGSLSPEGRRERVNAITQIASGVDWLVEGAPDAEAIRDDTSDRVAEAIEIASTVERSGRVDEAWSGVDDLPMGLPSGGRNRF